MHLILAEAISLALMNRNGIFFWNSSRNILTAAVLIEQTVNTLHLFLNKLEVGKQLDYENPSLTFCFESMPR